MICCKTSSQKTWCTFERPVISLASLPSDSRWLVRASFFRLILLLIFSFSSLPFFSSYPFWFLQHESWCTLWCVFCLKNDPSVHPEDEEPIRMMNACSEGKESRMSTQSSDSEGEKHSFMTFNSFRQEEVKRVRAWAEEVVVVLSISSWVSVPGYLALVPRNESVGAFE